MRSKRRSREHSNSRERKYPEDKHHAPKSGECSNSSSIPRNCSSNSHETSSAQSYLSPTVTFDGENQNNAFNFQGNYEPKTTYTTPKDLNPFTMEFEKVVKLLYREFLIDYLQRILAFLKGRNRELSFPHVGTLKEAFLIRLVKNKNNFHSKALNECCSGLCSDILKVVDLNRNSFRWIHTYEGGTKKIRRVLVYQKVPVNGQDSESSRFKVPQASPSQCMSWRSWYPQSSQALQIDVDKDEEHGGSPTHTDRSQLQWTKNEASSLQLTQQQAEFKEMFDAVSVPFMMSSLQAIVDFVDDAGGNVLEIEAKSQAETKFFKSLPTVIHKQSLYLMDKECVPLLERLRASWTREGLSVKCASPRHGRYAVRCIQIKKVACKKSKGRGSRGSRRSRRGRDGASYLAEGGGGANPFLKALSVSSDSEDTDNSYKVESLRSVVSAAHSIESIYSIPDTDHKGASPRYPQSKPAIQWQPAGQLDLSTESIKSTVDRGRHTLRRSKLQEALSVPVEPDKAKRMMHLMGWSGGALGARGDGITEPIMPAIDIVSGAGLGHTTSPSRRPGKERHRDKKNKPNRAVGEKSKSSRTPEEFRREVLRNMLEFLRNQDLKEKEIALSEDLSVKMRRFFRASLQALNARKNLGLNSEVEKDLIGKILVILNGNPTLGIDYKVSRDLRKYTLTKIEGRVVVCKRQRKKFERIANTYTESVISDLGLSNDCQSDIDDLVTDGKRIANTYTEPVIPDLGLFNDYQSDIDDLVTDADIENLIDKLTQTQNSSTKFATALAHRIIFLKKIYYFVVSNEEEKTVGFQKHLTKRYIRFVENVLQSLNSRMNTHYSTKTESMLYQDIRRDLPRNVSLCAIFSTNRRSFTLRRIEYKKRFINSAKSSTLTNREEKSQNNNNINEHDLQNCDNEDIHDSNNIDVETYDDHGEINDNRETVVLSESDDSVISLGCEYDLLGEDDDETDYNDDGNRVEGDGTTYRELEEEYGAKNGRRRSINDNLTDNVSEGALVTDTTSLDDSQDRYYGDGKELFQIAHIQSISTEKSNVDHYKNGEDMPSRVEKSSFHGDIESNQDTNGSMDSDVQEVINEIPIIDLVAQETIMISNAKSVEHKDIESINDEYSRIYDNPVANIIKCSKGENEDYSENPSPASSKRSRTASDSSDCLAKKRKFERSEESYVAIIPNSPDKVINRDLAAKIQEEILKRIETNGELPYLECHGIINGSLHYKCFDKNSLRWLDNIVKKITISGTSFIIIPSFEDVVKDRKSNMKMAMKTHSFLRENSKSVMDRINLYNPNIKTNEWVVLEETQCDDSAIFNVEVDYDSYKFIVEANYSVFAGIDKVEFSRLWV